MSMEYKICTRCIMDNKSDPQIFFDEQGVCCHCRAYDNAIAVLPRTSAEKQAKFNALVKEMKEAGRGKEYDCVLGISGGVDSAYLAYIANQAGLRILAVHVDAGWNTDVAVDNIKKLCSKLKIDLHTIVVDWPTMKELQRAYMFSGLPDLDVPQDHVFMAATIKFTQKYGINYLLNGSNFATEGILPSNYGYNTLDFYHISDVYKKCGRGRLSLKKYPNINLWEYIMINLGKVRQIKLLNYVDYSQAKAIDTLNREFDWNYYGGKHFESRFTKFFQSYYLPRKFGYEKKRAHISSLIVGGELSREQGLVDIEDSSAYTETQMLEDRDYILKKLDISLSEWEYIMNMPKKTEDDYKNSKKIINFLTKIKLVIENMRNVSFE